MGRLAALWARRERRRLERERAPIVSGRGPSGRVQLLLWAVLVVLAILGVWR